jgi:hypothetical protein
VFQKREKNLEADDVAARERGTAELDRTDAGRRTGRQSARVVLRYINMG